jgi:hypothetical protein
MKRAVWLFLLAASAADPTWAQSDACATVDPENFEQVYACLSSLQRTDGRTMAHGNLDTAPCRTVIARYRGAVRGHGVRLRSREPRAKSEPLYPSCALLARVVQDMTGKAAYWSGCLDYGSLPPAEHLNQCLKTVLPGYYGVGQGRGAQRLRGCGEVLGAYETGLRAAMPDNGLPPGYVRPDCQLAADVLAQPGEEAAATPPAPAPSIPAAPPAAPVPSNPAQDTPAAASPSAVPAPSGARQDTPATATPPPVSPPARPRPLPGTGQPQWATCLNYDPDQLPAHLRACLGTGREMRRMHECREVQAAYMAKLIQAYGRLPENHIVLPCSVAEGYLAEFRAQEEAERQAALERKKEQERQVRAQLVRDAEDLRDNPPPRPLFARPWTTWVILLALLGGAGWSGWRFVQRKRVRAAQAA